LQSALLQSIAIQDDSRGDFSSSIITSKGYVIPPVSGDNSKEVVKNFRAAFCRKQYSLEINQIIFVLL